MKKLTAALIASAAMFTATAASASGPFVTPAATTPIVFTGTATVQKGLTLSCDVVLTITGPEDAAHSTPAFSHTDASNLTVNISLSGGLLNACDDVLPEVVGPGRVTYTSAGEAAGVVTLLDVFVETPTFGDCRGNITARWNETAQSITFNTTMPGDVSWTSDCRLSGTLTKSSPSGAVDLVGTADAGHASH